MQTKTKENPLLLDQQLCFALYSTSRSITKTYARLLENLGVTYPQYLSLLALWETDGLAVQELARLLELEGATTTPIVQRLEKLGLVRRERSKDDERQVHIFLTKNGKLLRKQALEIPQTLGCATGIDQAHAQRLIAELSTIKNNLRY